MQESHQNADCVNNLILGDALYNDKELDHSIQQLWVLESVGIKESPLTDENQLMIERFNDTLVYKNSQYFVELPWKIPCPQLLDNFKVAKAHLLQNYKKLLNSNLLSTYDNIIREQKDRGFIEEVSEGFSDNFNCHYLTHRGVSREDSLTTKLRIVYNCGLKGKNNISLNDCLIEGPNLVNDLIKILLRFRLDRYAILGDISKAFLHINLKLDYDKNFLRFLWYKDPNCPEKGLVTFRFKVLLFGANCSPSILALTLQNHLSRFPDSFALEFLKNSFYVDNLMGSVSTEENLFDIFNQSNKMMNEGNFKLNEWISNCSELNSYIKSKNLQYSGDLSKVKTLGMHWDLDNSDSLSTKSYLLNVNAKTKREILSETSKIYDPLNLFIPCTIRARMFLQSLWKKEIGWDDALSHDDLKVWHNMSRDLNKVQNIKVKRCVGLRQNNNSLHLFADASSHAYGCCAYLVNEKESNLIYAKGKVTPIKNKRSIPQLELLAITLAVKVCKFLLDSYKDVNINDTFIWSDSLCCINWVQKREALKSKNVFVKNRLKEITHYNLSITYKHVPTKKNPADFISRGLSYKLLKSNKSWFCGPKFLTDKTQWDEVGLECNFSQNLTFIPDLVSLFDINGYSEFNKVIRVTNYCFKFINKCKGNIKYDALKYWLLHIQKKEFPEEISLLQTNNPKFKPGVNLSLISDLNLFLDSEGIIRCKGRISKSDLTYNSKNPVLLPRENHLTNLIIKDVHNRVHHMGISQTLNELRKNYWIPKGRVSVKSVLNTCTICKRIHSHSYKTPGPPQLPNERVNFSYPFETTGIDYTGAVNLNLNNLVLKSYVVLFTCTATRAVALDVVPDLTTESFISCFRRFSSKYNTPRVVWSDNALYFKGGEKEIQNLFDDQTFQNYLTQSNIKWKYIPVKSPWYGSIWERSIQTVKNCIKKSVGLRHISFFEFITLLAEIENVVNNRPLTYVSNNINDLEPLTPNHLLKGKSISQLPENINVEEPEWSLDSQQVKNMFSNRLKTKQIFIKRWKEEYLTSLRDQHKSINNQYWEDTIKVGDIVLIHDTTPRLSWSLGRVVDLFPGEDGVIRVAKLKTANGETIRDITLLYPLETTLKDPKETPNRKSDVQIKTTPTIHKPKRRAAIEAGKFLKHKISVGDI